MKATFLTALALLTAIRSQDDAAGLIERLRSEKIEDREVAARTLEEMGPSAVPALERVAKDGDEDIRLRAREIILRISVRTKIPPNLVKAMPGVVDRLSRNEWAGVFLEAAQEFEGPDRKYPELQRDDVDAIASQVVAASRTDQERKLVLEAVGRGHYRSATSKVIVLLHDQTPSIRNTACEALRDLRAGSAITEISKLLDDPHDFVHLTAIQTLAALRARSALAKMTEGLRHSSPGVRSLTAEALARFGHRESIPELERLLRDGVPQVRVSAAQSLARLQARGATSGLSTLLTDPVAEVRRSAAEALADLDVRQSVNSLAALLCEADESVREAAAEALGDLRAVDFAPDLANLLDDKWGSVRQASAKALGKLRAREFAPQVAKLLSEEDSYSRLVAIGALRRMNARAQIHDLVRRCSVKTVRAKFANSMGPTGPGTMSGRSGAVSSCPSTSLRLTRSFLSLRNTPRSSNASSILS